MRQQSILRQASTTYANITCQIGHNWIIPFRFAVAFGSHSKGLVRQEAREERERRGRLERGDHVTGESDGQEVELGVRARHGVLGHVASRHVCERVHA